MKIIIRFVPNLHSVLVASSYIDDSLLCLDAGRGHLHVWTRDSKFAQWEPEKTSSVYQRGVSEIWRGLNGSLSDYTLLTESNLLCFRMQNYRVSWPKHVALPSNTPWPHSLFNFLSTAFTSFSVTLFSLFVLRSCLRPQAHLSGTDAIKRTDLVAVSILTFAIFECSLRKGQIGFSLECTAGL